MTIKQLLSKISQNIDTISDVIKIILVGIVIIEYLIYMSKIGSVISMVRTTLMVGAVLIWVMWLELNSIKGRLKVKTNDA
jgi:hypothetical protein